LLAFLGRAVQEGFLKPQHRALLITADTAPDLLDRLAAYQPPPVQKWIGRAET
jgi:hypothetical protein